MPEYIIIAIPIQNVYQVYKYIDSNSIFLFLNGTTNSGDLLIPTRISFTGAILFQHNYILNYMCQIVVQDVLPKK